MDYVFFLDERFRAVLNCKLTLNLLFSLCNSGQSKQTAAVYQAKVFSLPRSIQVHSRSTTTIDDDYFSKTAQ